MVAQQEPSLLAPLRGAFARDNDSRWCRYAQPPANRFDPFGDVHFDSFEVVQIKVNDSNRMIAVVQ